MTPARRSGVTGNALALTTHALGAAAFLYPFFLGDLDRGIERGSHAGDAPVLFAALGVLLILLAVADLRTGRMDAKQVALLGVLAGTNAVLRMPGSLGGANLMFVLPILCGYAFGARFGFLLGASSMGASAALTGGVGPWLPFQMWALGWTGGGAGLLRAPLVRTTRRWVPVAALAAYGWGAGLVFGALLNLWFWPFQTGPASISWAPDLGAGTAAVRYWRFYVLTSLAWDSARAVANAVLIATVGAPMLRLLSRFRDRLLVRWTPDEDPRGTVEAAGPAG